MSFESVIGHAGPIQSLKRQIAQKRLPHALLFIGPEGVGKMRVAVETAKAVLCRAGGGEACGSCDDCRKADGRTHPDIIHVSPETRAHIVIGDVRALLGRISFKSLEAGAQFVIIDEADKMNDDAQNCLLKALEEPPADVHFILVASHVSSLLATVLSRCQRIRFETLSEEEARAALVQGGMPDAEALDLARLARGSLSRAEELRSLDARARVDAVFRLLASARAAQPAELPDWTHRAKDESFFEIDVLADVFRDLLVLKAAPESGARLFHADRAQELRELAGRYTDEDIDAVYQLIGSARENLEHSANTKILFMKLWSDIGVKWTA